MSNENKMYTMLKKIQGGYYVSIKDIQKDISLLLESYKEPETLKELGYEYGSGEGQFLVYPYGFKYSIDENYGYSGVNLGYEEICAIKLEMEKKQNE